MVVLLDCIPSESLPTYQVTISNDILPCRLPTGLELRNMVFHHAILKVPLVRVWRVMLFEVCILKAAT